MTTPILAFSLGLLAWLGLGGSTTRNYPLCFYQAAPTTQEYSDYVSSMTLVMKIYLGENAKIAFSPNARMVAARGSRSGHRPLQRAWPLMACVGDNAGAAGHQSFTRCVQYISQALKQKKGVPTIGASSDGEGTVGQLFCH